MILTETQLESFAERGFLVWPKFVDDDAVAALQHETAALHETMAAQMQAEGKSAYSVALANGVHIAWEERDDVWRIRQLMNSERVCPTIDRILRSAKMLAVVRQLIGSEQIIRYHSKLMMKPAGAGSFTPWHQDFGYWQYASREPTQLNCMLSIDAATLANGCIRFVEGSHKGGLVEHQKLKSSSFNIGLAGDIDAYENVPVETAPGDALFFGPLVIHGSAPNTSDAHRRANTFAFDKAGNLLRGDAEEDLL